MVLERVNIVKHIEPVDVFHLNKWSKMAEYWPLPFSPPSLYKLLLLTFFTCYSIFTVVITSANLLFNHFLFMLFLLTNIMIVTGLLV